MKNQCEATYLITKLNFPREKRCTNNATSFCDGKHYCGIHDPNKKEKRQETADIKKEEKRKLKANLNIAYLYAKQQYRKKN